MSSKQEIESRHRKFQFSWQDYRARNENLQKLEFDKYTIMKKIGSGSFATVYLAKITNSQEKVAVKVINLKSLQQIKIPKLKQIKIRLAHSQSRIMMHFSSQHIIKCYETFQSQDFKFMILQYCNGGDLAQKIQKQGKLEEDQAISIMKQIVNGLSECHRKGIIHRDLKPDNIMLHNGVCKLADFGFSKVLSINTENQNFTCINTTLGTPTTMAPQVKNFQPYGLKADIWSIGVIFFHMLFGKCPFQSRQNFNKIIMRISGVLEKQEFYEGVKISDRVRKFMKQVLVVDPKQRLGWKGLIDHEIFQQETEQEDLQNEQKDESSQFSVITLRSSCFQRKVSLNIDEQKLTQLQTDIVINPQQKNQQLPQKTNELNAENQSQKEIENLLRSLKYCDSLISDDIGNNLSNNQFKKNQDEIKRQDVQIKSTESEIINNPLPIHEKQQTLLYNWSRHAYLQCQKTELIYNKIILPIEALKLLDITHRRSIQFMYLLCTRCYNNMAPVFYIYQVNKNSLVLQQLTQMIEKLHNIVEKKWNRYSYILTQKQNQKLQIAADWTKRIILSKLFPQTYDYERREKFMTGIESVSNYHQLSLQVYEGFKQKLSDKSSGKDQCSQKVHTQQNKSLMKDYTRQEQIQYTIEYFNLTKDKFVKKQTQQCKQVMRYLNKFSLICNLSLEDLNNIPFKKYIEEKILNAQSIKQK